MVGKLRTSWSFFFFFFFEYGSLLSASFFTIIIHYSYQNYWGYKIVGLSFCNENDFNLDVLKKSLKLT